MDKFDYYKAPSDEIFNDIKENAVKIWQTYDNTHGYASEKIGRIMDIKNVSDNAWFIVAQFDMPNQQKLLSMVKPETAELIKLARGY
jgi:ribosome maturation protein Sdo1